MVLFDLDGTLVDSRPAILAAYLSAVREVLGFKLEPDAEHVQDLLRRRPIEYFRQHYPPVAEELATRYGANYSSGPVVAFPGIIPILQGLAPVVPIGIVSNKGRARILTDLAQVGLDPAQFAVIVGAEDTARRKPYPDPILKAVAEVRPAPSRVIYVGDGPHDVTAAQGASAQVIAVSWGYYPDQSLAAAGATEIAPDADTLSLLLRKALA